MRSTAARFIRDNVTGNLVAHGRLTSREGLRYRMADGTVHDLNREEAGKLGEAGYRPRYAPGAAPEGSRDQGDV